MADYTVEEYIESRSGFNPTDPTIVDLIEHAKEEVGNFCESDKIYNKAVALLVMHWATLNDRIQVGSNSSEIVGAVTGEKEGDLSRTYKVHGDSKIDDPFLSQTVYGLEFISLGRKCIFKPRNRFM